LKFWSSSKNLSFIRIGVAVSFLVITALIIVFFFGRRSAFHNNITRVYFADNISPAMQILIDRFNEENKGQIEVVPINLPFSKFSTNERKELLARSLRSKSDLIDVFSVDLIWSSRFAKWAQPLDLYFPSSERAKILDYALESCISENQLMAIPLYVDIGLMYYRRDLLQKLPDYLQLEAKLRESITWEEFIELKNKYFNNDHCFYIFPAKNYEGLICSFIELLVSQNGHLLENNSFQLHTPEAIKSLELLVDLVHQFRMTPPAVLNFDEYQGYLYGLENNAVFIRGWPGFLQHHRQIIEKSGKTGLFGIAATPHFKEGRPVAVLGGWNLMISKHSKHKWAAVKFLKFVLNTDSQKLLFSVGGYLPVNQEVIRDSILVDNSHELIYYQMLLKRAIHRPYTTDYTRVSDILSYYLHLAIKQELSPRAALEKAQTAIISDKFIIK
jgi:multiple sugar transport system substrate-binding protein